jgi:hypothetical protein
LIARFAHFYLTRLQLSCGVRRTTNISVGNETCSQLGECLDHGDALRSILRKRALDAPDARK